MSKIMNEEHHIKAKPLVLTLCLLVIQLGLIIGIFYYFNEDFKYFGIASILLSFGLIIYIINRPIPPAYQISWIVCIAIMPVFGGLLYLFLHIIPGTDRLNARLETQIEKTKPYLLTPPKEIITREADKVFHGLGHYLHHRCHFPITTGNATTYYSGGESAFEDLKNDLREAKNFIFMEYFIVSPGRMWDEVFEILKEKADRKSVV